MQKIKIKKSELLKKIKANYSKHMEDFHNAKVGYKQKVAVAVKKFYAKAVIDIENDKPAPHFSPFTFPANYESDYKTAINMLELSVDKFIELTREEFKNYVQDEWAWKAQFTNMVTGYYQQ